MVGLERVLALALISTAAWLLSILALEAGPEIAVAAGAMLVLLLAAIAWRHRLPIDRSARGVVGIATLMLAALVVLLPSLRGQALSIGPSSALSDTQWQVFDEAALRQMVSDGKVVFVDVTAAWCLTCKANELAVLDRPPVAARLHDSSVIAMRADWTRPDPQITTYLQSFGRYGVPLDVVYGPGAPQGIALPELLNAGAVMDAFQRAGAANARKQEAAQ
jgi:suppressor for copper-sensitivity B